MPGSVWPVSSVVQAAPSSASKAAPARRIGIRGVVILRVYDDGRGFDPQHVSPEQLGLGIMRERAKSVGATLAVECQRPR